MKNFEERLERLEELAETIKSPSLPLEDALSVFEEGIKLARGLEKELARIEAKVEILTTKSADESAEPALELFDGEGGS
ncbi:MAG TPA: exodeoxyribonuclease VII small subunit [Spirochaetales bacterium]|nr:exodeoxyribonuclease VII small subunit [Spirochaetales bacterium]